MSQLRAELAKQLRTLQEKYDFWLMAVAASVIALAVHDTHESALHWSQLPLAIAVLLWGWSFFAGCRAQRWVQAALFMNNERLRVEEGIHPLSGTNPALVALALEQADADLRSHNSKAARWSRWQFSSLIYGAMFYLAWHVIEMWLRTGK